MPDRIIMQVFVDGIVVGAVTGVDRIDARANAVKYFPDVTAAGERFARARDFVWINERFGLKNFDPWNVS